MRNITIPLFAALLIGGSALPAASQMVEVWPGGVGVDLRSPRQRERDIERRDFERERRADRRRGWDETGSASRCREVTVTERNEYGDRVTRTRRDCR